MKTANLTIVFTDIAGFTKRTSEQTLEENQRFLAAHSAILAPIFKAFGGRVVKTIGDSFMVVFESPTQALLSCLAVQDKVWLHNRSVAEAERFNVRAAVNVGEVRLSGNDVFGEPVNVASRVEGVTEPGLVYFTEAVYLIMDKVEVPSVEVGLFELRGIPEQVRIFQVPKGPHRMQAPAAPGEVLPEDMPPYGNLGLRRMPEDPLKQLGAELTSKAQAVFNSDLGGKAALAATELGSRAAEAATELGRQAVSRAAELERSLNDPAALDKARQKAQAQLDTVSKRVSPEVLIAAAIGTMLLLLVLLRACR